MADNGHGDGCSTTDNQGSSEGKFGDAASNDFKDNDEGIDGINKDGSCYGCY